MNGIPDILMDLISRSPHGVAVMRHVQMPNFEIVAHRIFANDRLWQMFGAKSLEQFVKAPVKDSWTEAKELQRVNKVLNDGEILDSIDAQRIRMDGSTIWMRMSSQPFETNEWNPTLSS